jgi:hypothetical protein
MGKDVDAWVVSTEEGCSGTTVQEPPAFGSCGLQWVPEYNTELIHEMLLGYRFDKIARLDNNLDDNADTTVGSQAATALSKADPGLASIPAGGISRFRLTRYPRTSASRQNCARRHQEGTFCPRAGGWNIPTH